MWYRAIVGRTGWSAGKSAAFRAPEMTPDRTYLRSDTNARTMPSRRRFLAGAGAVGSAGFAGCLDALGPDDEPGRSLAARAAGDATDWPAPNHDRQNTRYVPEGTAPRSGVEELWRMETNWSVTGPTVSDGTVFVTDGRRVRALDAEAGDERWRTPDVEGTLWTPPTVHDGVAYLVGGRGEDWNGLVRAFDAETGEERWRRGDERWSDGVPPVVGPDGNRLFLAAGEHVYELDPETGETRFSRRLFGRIVGLSYRPPVVYATTESGEVYAVSDDDGTGYWRTDLPDATNAAPTVLGRETLVSCYDGNVYVLGRRGQVKRTLDAGFGGAERSLALTDGTVYAVVGSSLVATGLDSGDLQWQMDLGVAPNNPPAVVGDTVYVGGDRLRAFKADGGFAVPGARIDPTRFSVKLEDEVGAVVPAEGRLYVVARDRDDEATHLLALGPR